MRWKYGKLLNNLGNAIDALAGRDARRSDLAARARAEGEAVLQAAGIDVITREEDAARRGDILPWGGAAASARGGSSSWQSLARGTGAIGRLPQRRDRAAGPAARRSHTGEHDVAAAGEPGRT
jgi:2-dehydropantoate 2-reductase